MTKFLAQMAGVLPVRIRAAVLATIAALLTALPAAAFNETGGSGLLRSEAAYSLPIGRPLFSLHGGYYDNDSTAGTARPFRLTPSVTLGLGGGFEAAVAVPFDGLTSSLDGGSYDRRFDVARRALQAKLRWTTELAGPRLRAGVLGYAALPVFADGRPGATLDPATDRDVGIMGLVSTNIGWFDVPLRLHLNAGYWWSRDDGAFMLRGLPTAIPVTGVAADRNDVTEFGLALEAGLRRAVVFLELRTEQFRDARDVVAARENLWQITPGFRTQLSSTVGLTGGVAFDLSRDDAATAFDPGTAYPDYEIKVGLTLGSVLSRENREVAHRNRGRAIPATGSVVDPVPAAVEPEPVPVPAPVPGPEPVAEAATAPSEAPHPGTAVQASPAPAAPAVPPAESQRIHELENRLARLETTQRIAWLESRLAQLEGWQTPSATRPAPSGSPAPSVPAQEPAAVPADTVIVTVEVPAPANTAAAEPEAPEVPAAPEGAGSDPVAAPVPAVEAATAAPTQEPAAAPADTVTVAVEVPAAENTAAAEPEAPEVAAAPEAAGSDPVTAPVPAVDTEAAAPAPSAEPSAEPVSATPVPAPATVSQEEVAALNSRLDTVLAEIRTLQQAPRDVAPTVEANSDREPSVIIEAPAARPAPATVIATGTGRPASTVVVPVPVGGDSSPAPAATVPTATPAAVPAAADTVALLPSLTRPYSAPAPAAVLPAAAADSTVEAAVTMTRSGTGLALGERRTLVAVNPDLPAPLASGPARAELDSLAADLLASSREKLIILVHGGGEDRLAALGATSQVADQVREYLLAGGVASEALVSVGMGRSERSDAVVEIERIR